MAIVTTTEIGTLLNRTLLDWEIARAQLDIDAVTETLENWLNTKLEETTIVDERHVGIAEVESMRFRWRPIKSLTGIKWDLTTNPLETTYNDWYDEQLIPRGQVYYVSYVTDASKVAGYTATLKRIVSNVAIANLLRSDPVRYGVITSYNVEGLSISYSNAGGGADAKAVGPIAGTDLSSLTRLRVGVIV